MVDMSRKLSTETKEKVKFFSLSYFLALSSFLTVFVFPVCFCHILSSSVGCVNGTPGTQMDKKKERRTTLSNSEE